MRRIASLTMAWLLLAGGVTACRGAARPLPPIPASASPVLLAPAPAPLVPSDQTLVDRVVAIVNGEVVMLTELEEAVLVYLQETKEPPPAPGAADELRKKVLDRLVNRRLQVQEAHRAKIEVGEDEIQASMEDFIRRNGGDRAQLEAQLRAEGLTWETVRRGLRESRLIQRVQARYIARRVSVTEAEVDTYLTANRAKFEADLKYRARHLLVLAQPPDQPTAWAKAKGEIDEVLARLRAGGDFAELARAYSKDGSAEGGGDLGWLARGELEPPFEAPILTLAAGGVTEPIRSENGYHLFKLEARQELTAEMLAQTRAQVRDLLRDRKSQERQDEWVQELRRRALIAERL